MVLAMAMLMFGFLISLVFNQAMMVRVVTARQGSFAITHTATADHSTRAALTAYTVPQGKGGTIYKIVAMHYQGVVDSDKPSGGLVELSNGSRDWVPFKFYTNSYEILTTTGGKAKPMEIPCNLPLPENSVVTVHYTAHDATSDVLTVVFYVKYQGFSGRQTYMEAAKGSAVTQITKATDHLTFTAIPSQKGGKAIAFLCLALGTPETAVMQGGLVELDIRSGDWRPTMMVLESRYGKTTMAGDVHATVCDLDHDLPDNSVVTAHFTPADNGSQYLLGMLMWEH